MTAGRLPAVGCRIGWEDMADAVGRAVEVMRIFPCPGNRLALFDFVR